VILHDPADEPESPKMAEVVAEKIRVRIAHHELEAGDPLPSETVLLAEYGVARPTMREALRILESEGLLTVKRGKGGGPRIAVPRVHGVAKQAGFLLQVSGTPLRDVLRARRVIEAPAIEDLAALTDPAVLDRLEENVEQARALVDDVEAIVARGTALHDEFHRVVVAAGAGDTLTLFHAVLERVIERSSRRFVGEQLSPRAQRSAYRATVTAHADVLRALRAEDGDAAAAAWHRHLDEVEGYMLRSTGETRVVDLFG
jgi:DNA-binding FadR family transcriptional regulator